jgi:hypothetical protein
VPGSLVTKALVRLSHHQSPTHPSVTTSEERECTTMTPHYELSGSNVRSWGIPRL